jgi:hypothetical protein
MYWTMSSILLSSSRVRPIEDFSHRSGGMSLGRDRRRILLVDAEDDEDDFKDADPRFLWAPTDFPSWLLLRLLDDGEDDRGLLEVGDSS